MSSKLTHKFKCNSWTRFQKRFDSQLKDLKVALSHLGLYLGLIVYTAIGAWVRFKSGNQICILSNFEPEDLSCNSTL